LAPLLILTVLPVLIDIFSKRAKYRDRQEAEAGE
jgi:hypothetical protein